VPDSTAQPESDWNGRQLAAWLLVLDGAAPTPVRHVVYRATRFADGREVMGYELPGEPGSGDEAALRRWLARDNLTGDAQLGLSVLVINEVLNAWVGSRTLLR
jgi:hypothetical protein